MKTKTFLGLNGKERPVARSDIAVLIIDMQRDFVSHLRKGEAERIIPNQLCILEQCLRLEIPIIVIECKTYKYGKTVSEITVTINDAPYVYFIEKRGDDAFINTQLHKLLQELGVKTLVMLGINADYCVMDTARSALKLEYKILTSNDVISGQSHHSRTNSSHWYQNNGMWVDSTSLLASNLS
ncbi:cysteine hydrolase [Candidatus Parcubacteria bacterium]|jgi:nicotinamidase-related amidase|nr:cysteine hydrolase [Candidatus Parcubacteria bacterium]